MNAKLFRYVGLGLGISLFCVALRVLYSELANFDYWQIVAEFRAVGAKEVVAAMSLTALSYMVLTAYDFLSIVYIKENLAYWNIAFTSFISFAVSYSVGFSIFSGGTIRYRLYSEQRLDATSIAKLIIFNALTFWIGFFALTGTILAFSQSLFEINDNMVLSGVFIKWLGVSFQAIVLCYLLVSLIRTQPFKFKNIQFDMPPIKLTLYGILAATVDWCVAAAVLYVLIPNLQISFIYFMAIFLLAQVMGLLSHLPGGVGVFEATFVTLLSPHINANIILGRLVAYRIIYYLIPFFISILLLSAHELADQKHIRFTAKFIAKMFSELMPRLITFGAFASGLLLLLTGAMPAHQSRLTILHNFLPLPVIEVSHFLGSIIGAALLFLARGLQLRIRLAYILSINFLVLGTVFSITRSLDYEIAVALTVILIALILCRRSYYRQSAMVFGQLPNSWILSIGMAMLAMVWLVMFAYKHVEYSHDLWWQFTLEGHAPRSMRAAVAAAILTFCVAFAKIFSVSRLEPQVSSVETMQRVKELCLESPRTYAHLALLRDKMIMFNDKQNAFIMYGLSGKSAIALCDPVGQKEEHMGLIWKFRELCYDHHSFACFYQVHPANLPNYLDAGLSLIKLGEEAIVPLENFSLSGKSKSGLRSSRNKLVRDGYSFVIISEKEIKKYLPDLCRISNSWLKRKNAREKGFSLGFFSEEYLENFSFALVIKDERVIAFANILIGGNKEELSIDLMRFSEDAPNGAMDYLFCNLMLWGQENGFKIFNLGMSPLSGLQARPLASTWYKISALVFHHGEHFYNFEGLRQYKEKFDPVWEPRYLASDRKLSLLLVLKDIASLISGGMMGILS